MRILGVIRLSSHSKRADDPSTSPERQKAHILAGVRPEDTIEWAEDLNVSAAKIPPWHRPQLGLWLPDLTDERNPRGGRPDDFDVIRFWKLDRLVRSIGDFSRIITWITATGKNLVSSDGHIDLSTPHGKAMAQMTAVFAELEAAIIRERIQEGRYAVLSDGRWHGGRTPYGYQPVKLDSGGWKLIPHPEHSAIIEEIIKRIIANEPAAAIGEDLTARGVPTPKGSKKGYGWEICDIPRMMRSRTILGELAITASVDGVKVPQVINRADPLVDLDTWSKLQQALTKRPRRQKNAGLLLQVAFCPCGLPLYQRSVDGIRYYRCAGATKRKQKACLAAAVREVWLTESVERMLLDSIGDLEIYRVETRGAVDNTAELQEIQRKLAELLVSAAGASEGVKRALEPKIELLTDREAELAEMPITPGEVTQIPTGKTYRQLWEEGAAIERRNLLLNSNIRVEARKVRKGEEALSQSVPVNIRDDDTHVLMTRQQDVVAMMFLPRDLSARMTNKDQDLPYRDQTLWQATQPL